MSLFDFSEEIEIARADTFDENDRAAARTTVPRHRLPDAVKSAGWRFLDQTSSFVPGSRDRELVIGVAPWNPLELGALGALSQSSANVVFSIHVFDIDDFEDAKEIEQVLPGTEPPRQTPVVAEYYHGELVRSEEGVDALHLLTDYVT